jgi:hypothetical protein
MNRSAAPERGLVCLSNAGVKAENSDFDCSGFCSDPASKKVEKERRLDISIGIIYNLQTLDIYKDISIYSTLSRDQNAYC